MSNWWYQSDDCIAGPDIGHCRLLHFAEILNITDFYILLKFKKLEKVYPLDSNFVIKLLLNFMGPNHLFVEIV